MENVDLIERKELLQNNEKSNRKKSLPLVSKKNASKHIRSRKKKLVHSTDQS